MSVHVTSCPRNCYSTCSMAVHVEEGRIRRIDPVPSNEATPEGVCLKGLSYVERQHSRDRILHPLRRDPGSGEFHRVSWDDALDEICRNLVRFRSESGPQSVLYYSASGTKGILNEVGMNFWRLYGGCTTVYGDLCWPAGLEATRLTLGDNKHSVPWDLENARLIVFWGKNAAETNVHQMVFVERAVRQGARVVVIDPRRTETAERADLFLQPRPGTDGKLALAVAHVLFREGWIDEEFIGRNVFGVEELRELVREETPSAAAEVCEIDAAQIEALAREIGTIRPATIACGYGMQRYTNSGQSLRAILSLLALTGNVGRPGAGWQFANLQSHVFGAQRDPVASFPPEKPDGVVRVSISTARLGPEMLATQDPPLRMVWVERGNPVAQNPESNTVIEAFRRLEFRVVVEQFLTDTAREADLILPSKTLFEQTDVINAYWHPYVQIKKKLVEPAGEVKPESVLYHEIARRLGLEGDLDTLLPVTDEQVESYLRRRLSPHEGLTLERLEEGPVAAPGHQEIAFSDLRFDTPSGKIELVSDEARDRWKLDRLPSYTEPEESIRTVAPDLRDERLYLLTPNTKNRIHSQFNNLEMIRRVSPGPSVSMHPEDARRRDVDAGDEVILRNERGELRLPVSLEASLKPGCVVVTNGWWISDGAGVNLLSRARETDMGHGAAFHDNLVEVVRTR